MKSKLQSVSLGGIRRLATMAIVDAGVKIKQGFEKKARLLYRTPKLMVYDDYLNNLQYSNLKAWSPDLVDQQIDNRVFQPKKVFPLPNITVDTLKNHITTEESRLNIVHDKPKVQEEIDDFLEDIMLWATIDSGLGSYLANGSMFIRFFCTSKNKIILETHNTKHVYPTFDDSNELVDIVIRYIYETEEYDETKEQVIWRWSQYRLSSMQDITYDNPIYEPEDDIVPEFKELEVIQHNSGFIQGEWIKTSCCPSYIDGESFLSNSVIQYLDDFNYLASKQSSSLYYHLFPFLLSRGSDEGELNSKSLTNMEPHSYSKGNDTSRFNVISTGRPLGEADLSFLEAGQHAMAHAFTVQDNNLQLLQYIVKTVLLDPEKVAAHAQSGRAMEALYKPVVQNVKKKRPFLKKGIVALLKKLEAVSNAKGMELKLPLNCLKESKMTWGNIFTDSVTEIAQRVTYTTALVNSGVISRESAIKHIAKDLDIASATEELSKIEAETQQQAENDLINFNKEQQIVGQAQPQGKPPAKKPPAQKKA